MSCGSLGSVLWFHVLILCFDFVSLSSYFIHVLGPGFGFVFGSIDIFKFLLKKKGWVKLYIILAIQSIKVQAQRERCRQACMIGSLLMRIQS